MSLRKASPFETRFCDRDGTACLSSLRRLFAKQKRVVTARYRLFGGGRRTKHPVG